MILEFRIPLPIKTEEFQVAQLFMVASASEKVTGGGEGIQVIKNEPFTFVFCTSSTASITRMAIWV